MPLPEEKWFLNGGVTNEDEPFVFGGKYFSPNEGQLSAHGPQLLVRYDAATGQWQKAPVAEEKWQIVRAVGTPRIHEKRYTGREPIYLVARLKRWPAPAGLPDESDVGSGSTLWRGGLYWPVRGRSLGRVSIEEVRLDQGDPGQRIPYEMRFRSDRRSVFRRRTNFNLATSPNGSIYLIGGITAPQVDMGGTQEESRRRDREQRGAWVAAECEVFDAESGVVRLIASMRTPRQIAASAFGPDGKLYVFGGYGGVGWSSEGDDAFVRAREWAAAGAALDRVESYDPVTDRWSLRAPMPQGLQMTPAALGADGRIWIVGGSTASAGGLRPRVAYAYDPALDQWFEGPKPLSARLGHALVVDSKGVMFAIGGIGALSLRQSLQASFGIAFRAPHLKTVEMLNTRQFAGAGVRWLTPIPRRSPREGLEARGAQLKTKDPRRREDAVIWLADVLEPRDADVWAERLVPLLSAERPITRREALEALMRMEAASTVAAMRDRLLAEDDPSVRIHALEVLARLHPTDSAWLPEAFQVLRTGHKHRRLRAAQALLRADPVPLALLERELRDEAHPFPDALIDIFERLGDAGVGALTRALRDARAEVRRAALGVLRHRIPEDESLLPAIAASLDDEDEPIALLAHVALAEFGPKALPTFMARARSENEVTRGRAIWGVGDVGKGDREAGTLLQQAIDRRVGSVTRSPASAVACASLLFEWGDAPEVCEPVRRLYGPH